MIKHPFEGGRKTSALTRCHVLLIWEAVLGTVYACSPNGEVVYFDYDWQAARKFAAVEECDDLRICKAKTSDDRLRKGQLALWGIRQTMQPTNAKSTRAMERKNFVANLQPDDVVVVVGVHGEESLGLIKRVMTENGKGWLVERIEDGVRFSVSDGYILAKYI